MNRNRLYIRVLLVLLSLAILIILISHAPHRSAQQSWLPSSLNPVGAGHMAFYETLAESGWPVTRWREPLSRLPDRPGQLLIVTRALNGRRVNFTEEESARLENWVKQGNTLFLLGAFADWDDTRVLLRAFGYQIPEPASGNDLPGFLPEMTLKPPPPLQLSFQLGSGEKGSFSLPATSPLPLGLPKDGRIIAQQDNLGYLAEFPHGSGRVLYATSPALLANHTLEQADGLELVLDLLAPQGHLPSRIYFEESHHGFSAVYALVHLLDQPGLGYAGALVLLGGLVYLSSSLTRFGEIIPLRVESGRSMLEFIHSMADLYARAKLRTEVIRYLFERTHEQILLRFHLPRHTSHEIIAQRLQETHPELPKWKKLALRFDSNDYVQGLPPNGWLRVARDLIRIKSALS